MLNSKINVLVVDDEILFRDGLISLLNKFDIHVSDVADDGQQALKILKSSSANIVLLDLEMPLLNGSKTLDNIQQRFPGTKVIILSSYHDEMLIKDHFNRGAKAFLSKKENIETVVSAIYSVHLGNIYKNNIPELLKTKVVKDKHYYKLIFSPREREIITLLCAAKTCKDIGNELCISERTVEAHLTVIYKKVGVKNRNEFLIFALKEGLQYLGKPKGSH